MRALVLREDRTISLPGNNEQEYFSIYFHGFSPYYIYYQSNGNGKKSKKGLRSMRKSLRKVIFFCVGVLFFLASFVLWTLLSCNPKVMSLEARLLNSPMVSGCSFSFAGFHDEPIQKDTILEIIEGSSIKIKGGCPKFNRYHFFILQDNSIQRWFLNRQRLFNGKFIETTEAVYERELVIAFRKEMKNTFLVVCSSDSSINSLDTFRKPQTKFQVIGRWPLNCIIPEKLRLPLTVQSVTAVSCVSNPSSPECAKRLLCAGDSVRIEFASASYTGSIHMELLELGYDDFRVIGEKEVIMKEGRGQLYWKIPDGDSTPIEIGCRLRKERLLSSIHQIPIRFDLPIDMQIELGNDGSYDDSIELVAGRTDSVIQAIRLTKKDVRKKNMARLLFKGLDPDKKYSCSRVYKDSPKVDLFIDMTPRELIFNSTEPDKALHSN